MLSCELSKELHDAGFSNGHGKKYYPDVNGQYRYNVTLSELIEICERLRDFYLYRHFVGGEYSVEWEAVLIKRITEDGQLHEYQNKAKGVTPEEAVARLWLELNKKS